MNEPPHNRRSTDTGIGYIKSLTGLIIATTGFLTALAAMGVSCDNKNRLDVHKEAILENKKAIDENSETITHNAQATNDVAESVGLPAMAAPPPSAERKE